MALSKNLQLPPLISLIASCSLFHLMLANKVHSQGDATTTTFAFDSFSPNSKNLTYQCDAFVPSGSSFVRLTKTDTSGKPAQFSVGRVVYSPPVQFWEPGRQASFEATLKFKIISLNNDPGDGITFFIIPVNSPIPNPSTGGSFGLFDLYTGISSSAFAVEFDTYFGSDNRNWDPSYRHIGIDINSRTSRNVTRFENPFGQVVTAHIYYVSSTRTICVFASYGSQTSFLTYVFDLKTILPRQVQVGISGATGGSVSVHDLLSWRFTSALVWDRIDLKNQTSKNQDLKQYA